MRRFVDCLVQVQDRSTKTTKTCGTYVWNEWGGTGGDARSYSGIIYCYVTGVADGREVGWVWKFNQHRLRFTPIVTSSKHVSECYWKRFSLSWMRTDTLELLVPRGSMSILSQWAPYRWHWQSSGVARCAVAPGDSQHQGFSSVWCRPQTLNYELAHKIQLSNFQVCRVTPQIHFLSFRSGSRPYYMLLALQKWDIWRKQNIWGFRVKWRGVVAREAGTAKNAER